MPGQTEPGVKKNKAVCVPAVTQKFWLTVISHSTLTLILLTWRIWWAPNNDSKCQMGFNSVFKGLST